MKRKKLNAGNSCEEIEEAMILSPLHGAKQIKRLVKNPDIDENYRMLRDFLKSLDEDVFFTGHPLYVPKRNQMLYIVFGAVALLTAVYLFILNFSLFIFIGSESYHSFSAKFLLVSVAVLIVNALLLAYSANEIQFQKHYAKYCSILRFRGVEAIELLSAYTKIKPKNVVRDLKMAVKKELISEGSFQDHDKVFSVSRRSMDLTEEKLCRLSHEELKNMHDEIGKSLAKYIGQTGISQMKDKMPEALLNETVETLTLYCYEVQAHSENNHKTVVVLNSFLDAVQTILCGEHGNGAECEWKDQDREDTLHLLNKLFYSLLCELYRQ